jgi:hypothetical protein
MMGSTSNTNKPFIYDETQAYINSIYGKSKFAEPNAGLYPNHFINQNAQMEGLFSTFFQINKSVHYVVTETLNRFISLYAYTCSSDFIKLFTFIARAICNSLKNVKQFNALFTLFFFLFVSYLNYSNYDFIAFNLGKLEFRLNYFINIILHNSLVITILSDFAFKIMSKTVLCLKMFLF